jgi:hypothetical protein
MCVDFRDLNKASIKDNFPLPNMEFLLQQVTRSTCMSMLDGFSRYNEFLVDEEDREKTTFITPWETYAYAIIPFDLKNVGAMFQRAMDHAFIGRKGKFMVDYQHDLTVHLRKREDLIHHLRFFFERCRSYSVSVNSNLVQYLLQTDIQKRTEKIQWQIQTLHRDFSPGNPNRENQHILY